MGIFFIPFGCDDTTGPPPIIDNFPAVTNIATEPDLITFSKEQDGYKDTTVTVQVISTIDVYDAETALFFVVKEEATGNRIAQDDMELQDGNRYTGTFDIETSTTTFANYVVEVHVINKQGNGNYAQKRLVLQGFSNAAPELLETILPDTTFRPISGSVFPMFTAKVADQDGQETIDKVYIKLVNQPLNQDLTYTMVDNGTEADAVANDSVYSWSIEITPTTNTPNRDYQVEVFAIDQAGLSSDTVRTTWYIREKQ